MTTKLTRLAMDVRHCRGKIYLTMIDCSSKWIVIRKEIWAAAAMIIAKILNEIFLQWGPVQEVLLCCIAISRFMQNITTQWRQATQSFRKICTSHFIWKGLCVRGSWRLNRTATYWPPLLWPSVFLSCSPDAAQPEVRGPSSLLDAGFLYRILSLNHLISN